MIAIHSPETSHEKDPLAVAGEVKKRGIEYPVVLDNDLKLWKSYHQQYWPFIKFFNSFYKNVYDLGCFLSPPRPKKGSFRSPFSKADLFFNLFNFPIQSAFHLVDNRGDH